MSIPSPSSSGRRIAYAIALSILLHALILWLPKLHLAELPAPLPPLSVRLEPLHDTPALPTPAALANPVSLPAPKAAEEAAAEAAGAMRKADKPAVPQPFPRRMQLDFEVRDAQGRSEIQQQLDINGDGYTLQSLQRSSGLSTLTHGVQITRISRGHVSAQGLRPDSYEEERLSGGARQNSKASFDWEGQRLTYAGGTTADLPAGTQDALSLAYQLGLLDVHGEVLAVNSTDGETLQHYELEIGRDNALPTPMGDLHTLRLRKIHREGEPYFEIWLGLDYRLLPVKLLQVDGSGKTQQEQVISAIRVKDE